MRRALAKGGSLVALTATEMLVPFVRMIILTHILGPFEFGFAAALSAAYATIEQITDTGLFRFVLASPRDRYKEALATAHGIALIRGVLVAAVFLAVAYPTACTITSCGDWQSFAWLAPLTIIKSAENLEIRVFERDYRYWPQLTASIVSHSIGLLVMALIGVHYQTHYALLGYLGAQSLSYVVLTHLLTKTRFSVALRTPMVREALHYSLPLMMNGAGNAIMAQGDRLFVGAVLGVETLGLYAVMILTAYVPTSGLSRLMGPIQFAGLMNASDRADLYAARLRLYCRSIPIVAAIFALGWIVLSRPFVQTILGNRFVMSDIEILLIAMIIYFRICRAEPATSQMLQSRRTKQLAFANQIPIVGLALAATFTFIRPALESVLLGTTIGEVLAFGVMLQLARPGWGAAWRDSLIWSSALALFPAALGAFLMAIGPSDHMLLRVEIGIGYLALLAIIAWFGLRRLAVISYLTKTAAVVPIDADANGKAVDLKAAE
jgi:O-antigen/teichoic acid export membrane protein